MLQIEVTWLQIQHWRVTELRSEYSQHCYGQVCLKILYECNIDCLTGRNQSRQVATNGKEIDIGRPFRNLFCVALKLLTSLTHIFVANNEPPVKWMVLNFDLCGKAQTKPTRVTLSIKTRRVQIPIFSNFPSDAN